MVNNNSLRSFRKRSLLTLADIAFLLQVPDYSSVSRWETGLRAPNLDMLVGYSLLFDVPMESFFEKQKERITESLVSRISTLISESTPLKESGKFITRKLFLESTLTRLSA